MENVTRLLTPTSSQSNSQSDGEEKNIMDSIISNTNFSIANSTLLPPAQTIENELKITPQFACMIFKIQKNFV